MCVKYPSILSLPFFFFFFLFRILFEFFPSFKINIVNFFILLLFFHFYILRVRFHANRLSRVKEIARSYRFYKICYTLLVLYRCREYEIRIFVDIRVQFYVKSSGTFDGFLFILYWKLTKNFFFLYILYINIRKKKNNWNYHIKLSILCTRWYIFFFFFCHGLVHGFVTPLLYILNYYYLINTCNILIYTF